MPTLQEVGEFEAIRRVLAARPAVGSGVVLGSGDDAAVLRLEPGMDLVATTDAFIEEHHWRRDILDAGALGARLAAANLSDLAAMAARPRWGLISMGLRLTHDLDDLLAIDQGIARALAAHGASLVGGNFSAVTGEEWMSLTLLGSCAAGRAWTRAGARPGDLLAVTGHPGRAAAALAMFTRHGVAGRGAWWEPLADAWRAPASRVEFAARAAATDAVTAAVDISDGLSSDLAHLCQASGVGAELDLAAWPQDPFAERAAAELGLDVEALRFRPGDDYELILAVAAERKHALEEVARDTQTPLNWIGHMIAGPELRVRDRDGSHTLRPSGWDHFGG